VPRILPALMLLRDLASKDWNRREWTSISRSKSSSSLGASNTVAALPRCHSFIKRKVISRRIASK
jgi:hypothetical protein